MCAGWAGRAQRAPPPVLDLGPLPPAGSPSLDGTWGMSQPGRARWMTIAILSVQRHFLSAG